MDLREVPKTLIRRHPWEVARARFFRNVLKGEGALDHPAAVLDVGAGDGYLAATLLEGMPHGSRVTCFDAHYADDDMARFAGATRSTLTFSRARPTQPFEIILLLDVIEHVEDDRGFLSGFVSENLESGGVVLVSVPAWQWLFTRHDVGLEHFRRYSPHACRRLLAQANLTITRSGGLFHGPLFLRMAAALHEWAARRIGRSIGPSAHLGQWKGGPILSAAVERVLFADNFLSYQMARLGWSLPGLSFWALCRKISS